MIKSARSILAIGIIAALHSLSAAPVEEWFEKANSYYERAAYDSAVLYYEKITNSGINNSAVYFNLGNAYFRLNRLGCAILYYEKARMLSPHDQDIAANLRFAQANIVDKVPQPQRGFIASVLWYLHTMFPLQTQLWILIAFLFVLNLCFAGGLFASHNLRLWLIYIGVLCSLVILSLGFSAGYKMYAAKMEKSAILLQPTVDAKNQPNGSKILFTAHEGVKFSIRKTIDNWSLVSLPNGVSGWVENEALGKI